MSPVVIDANVWVSAADRRDEYSDISRSFLETVTSAGLDIVVPAHALLEVACAMARRLRDARRGRALARRLFEGPMVRTHQLNESLLGSALESGTDLFLRSGDALYAGAATRLHAQLVSWDRELVERASALTPESWLAESAA